MPVFLLYGQTLYLKLLESETGTRFHCECVLLHLGQSQMSNKTATVFMMSQDIHVTSHVL